MDNPHNTNNGLSRRRMVKLLGMSAASAAFLAACGDSTTATTTGNTQAAGGATGPTVAASGKVVFYTAKDATGTAKKLVDAFNAKNTGVTIEYQEGPNDTTQIHDKFASSFAAKDASIDLIAADIAWVAEFGAANFLLPLDTYLKSDFRANFFDGTLLGTTYKDKTYAVPWYLNAGLLYYRKDLLEKAGVTPPNTFDELTAAAQKLQTADTYGYIFHGFKNEGLSAMWLEVLWGFGGNFWDEKTGKVLVNSPEAEASLQWLVNSIYDKKISPDKVLTFKYAEVSNVYNQGNAVFARHWADYAGQAQGAESKIKDKWASKPFLAANGVKPAGTLGTWNLAINVNSKNPSAAWKVIEYLSSTEAQRIRALGTGAPPALKAAYNDKELLAANPAYATLSDTFQTARPRPVTPAYSQVSTDAIQDNVSKALSRQITPKEAIKNMAAKAEQILAAGK